jgi:hypothetical protein
MSADARDVNGPPEIIGERGEAEPGLDLVEAPIGKTLWFIHCLVTACSTIILCFARTPAILRYRSSRRANSSGICMPSGMSRRVRRLGFGHETGGFHVQSRLMLPACSKESALCRLALACIFVPPSPAVPIFSTPIPRASSSA